MNFQKLRSVLLSGLLAVCSLGALNVHSQTVTVNGNACSTASVTFAAGTIQINAPSNCVGVAVSPPNINASTPPIGNLGAVYSHQFTASGAGPISWTSSGALPGGLTLNAGTGLLSGTPTAAAVFPFSVTANNSGGSSAPLSVSVTISPPSGPPLIQNAAPATATIGVPYSHQYTATGALPINYLPATGLPPGITLITTGSTAGLLSGTPTTAGAFSFNVTATNGTTPDDVKPVTITVSALAAPTITSGTPPAGTATSAYTFNFAATSAAAVTWSVLTGALPPGLALSASGALAGTPTTAGSYTFSVRASNGASSNTDSPTYTVAIASGGGGGSGFAKDTAGNNIPFPISRHAKEVLAPHVGANGGGNSGGQEIRGWSVDATRCKAVPPISTLWYHNIDLLEYGSQSALDYFDFAPNQALSYGFVANAIAAPNNSQVVRVFINIGPNGTPASTFFSVSTSPCDFDTAKVAAGDKCYASAGTAENGFTLQITTNASSPVCKLTPGTQYYLNLRFQDARIPTVDACAAQLATNPGSATCGALMQIQSYPPSIYNAP